ncbi:hypothetical protein pb186bvf_002963 [Paramecium bursaria]
MMQKQDNRNDMMHQISKKVMIFSFLTIIFMILATLVSNIQSQTYSKGQKIHLIFIMKKFNLEQYELQQTISLGTYFRMRVAKPKQGNKAMQIKTYRKQDLLKLEIQKTHLSNEIQILSNIHISNQFIIQYYGYAVDQRYIYLLFEHLAYGDIFRRQLTNIQFYISQVVLAILHLQKLQIIHRDIKLENFCMAEDGYIKLVDFSFAKIVKTQFTNTLCGTPECSAPEVIAKQPYDFSVDFWSLGVLIFELIDESPFYDEDTYQIYKKILYGKPKYSKKFNTISKSLCKQLLSRDPKQRLSKPVQDHEFFQSINWNQIEAKKIKPPFVPLKSEIQYYQTYPESDGRAEEPKEDPFFNW